MKPSEPHKGPADYAGLWEQWAGADTKMTGPSGRTGPEVVALAIASAIEDPATPFGVPVGQDAEMILGLRRSLDDQAFEDAMRKAVGLSWGLDGWKGRALERPRSVRVAFCSERALPRPGC